MPWWSVLCWHYWLQFFPQSVVGRYIWSIILGITFWIRCYNLENNITVALCYTNCGGIVSGRHLSISTHNIVEVGSAIGTWSTGHILLLGNLIRYRHNVVVQWRLSIIGNGMAKHILLFRGRRWLVVSVMVFLRIQFTITIQKYFHWRKRVHWIVDKAKRRRNTNEKQSSNTVA